MKAKTFRELRDRLADQLLTALTIMLAILLFVIAPLQLAELLPLTILALYLG